MDMMDYMTKQQAAAVLHCHEDTIARRIREDAIQAVRVGRRVLVSKESLAAYLARCEGQAKDKDANGRSSE